MERVRTVSVNSLGELLDRCTPAQPDPASGRLRDSAVYRGVGQVNGRLLSSLDRLGGTEPPHTKAHLEEHLLRNFLRYGSPYLSERAANLWETMVVAEHHGLPTRLLDWTHSPLVAAHFATLATDPTCDRVIWKLDGKLVHERFGLRDVLFLVDDLEELLRERGLKNEWDLLNAPLPEGENFVCLLEPPAISERLAVQSGVFTFSTSKEKSLDRILDEAGITEALTRYVLPAERINFVRDQLDLCTLDERRLFPGLDGVAAALRRYYAAGGEQPQALFCPGGVEAGQEH